MTPKAVLVLRLSALGDIIHTLPAVEAMRSAWPDARIGWVVERPFAEFVELTAPVDEVIVVATKRWRRSPFATSTRSEFAEFRRALRKFGRDAISVDFQGLIKSSVLGSISRAHPRYGFGASFLKEKAASVFYHEGVEIDSTKHVIEWNTALAQGAGAGDGSVPEVKLERLPHDPLGRLGPLLEHRPVVLLPGAGWPEKQWPIDHFARLAIRVTRELGRDVLVAWGPGEVVMAREIATLASVVLAPPTDLRELAFVLSRASLVVAGDTGPLHLAAALKTPTIGLYGPTDPTRNGPWEQIDGCLERFTTDKSLSSIDVDEVFEQVESRLDSEP